MVIELKYFDPLDCQQSSYGAAFIKVFLESKTALTFSNQPQITDSLKNALVSHKQKPSQVSESNGFMQNILKMLYVGALFQVKSPFQGFVQYFEIYNCFPQSQVASHSGEL